MEKLKTFIAGKIENIKAVLTGRYEKDAQEEDPNAYRALQNYIVRKNAGRVVVFAAFSLIAGILELIFGVDAAVTRTGSVVLIAGSAVFCWLCAKTVFSRESDHALMRLFTILFWLVFTAGFLCVSAGEQIEGRFPYSFLIFVAAVFSVPVVNFYESLFFAAVLFIYPAVYGSLNEKEVMFYISAAAVTVSYLWIAAVVRCCYANIRIGEYRLENIEERCTQIARKDTLTGLLNKAGLSAKFSELSEAKGEKKISVILIDIDNFRAYNHMYGYDASDSCLYRVCNCLKIVAKQYTQLISRFGGDDFVLILENMDEIETVKLAEQLRQSVEQMAQPFGNGIVTVSVGVSGSATLKSKNTYSELLNEADDQLIIAKGSGRNCIGFKGRPFIHEGRVPASGIFSK
ncbi:MAG: GGDEF domain-containing protein [Ruminiclostridium sp.]|nr:GGDEF domain-containing protein [Ruminiclostridium sp.]